MKVTYFRLGQFLEFARVSDRAAPPAQVAKALAVVEEVRRERLPYEIRKMVEYARETHDARMKA